MRVKRRIFTLIELLVVVAIIGILASMLLPSLAKARAAAQLKVCMSNQRQTGLAAQMYAETYDGRFVGDFNNEGTSDLFFASKYLAFISDEEYTGPLNYSDMSDCFRETGAYQCPSAKLDVALDITVNSIDTEHYNNTGKYRGVWAHNPSTFPKSLDQIGYLVETKTREHMTREITTTFGISSNTTNLLSMSQEVLYPNQIPGACTTWTLNTTAK